MTTYKINYEPITPAARAAQGTNLEPFMSHKEMVADGQLGLAGNRVENALKNIGWQVDMNTTKDLLCLISARKNDKFIDVRIKGDESSGKYLYKIKITDGMRNIDINRVDINEDVEALLRHHID